MKAHQSFPLIDVDAVRLGMFIYLDLGWMSHPFPLSQFKISTLEQLNTLKGLRLKQVRWNPAQSDPDAVAEAQPDAQVPSAVTPADAVPPSSEAMSPAHLRREAVAQQRTALMLCERQFAEATRECRQMHERVAFAPQEAGAAATALSRALLDKMMGSQEVAIRLLSDAAGDKSSAHAVNVALLSLLLGRALGWSDAEMMDLGVGALTHDVGKMALPERVRHRQEHFSPAELRLYEDHVAHGVSTAKQMGLSAGALLVIAQHHEMLDGSGFPTHAGSDKLTPASRVVALVNRYDNLCNPHIPSHALTPHEALSLMFAQGRSKFDTLLLSAFIKMMGVYPPGSLVQLSDERYAMVVGVNSSRPLKPSVLAYERKTPRDEALITHLEDHADVAIRRSVKPTALPPEALIYLSPRQRVAYFFEPTGLQGNQAEVEHV